MSGLQFDNKISLGHILSAITMLIAGVFAYASVAAEQASQARRLDKVEQSQQDREVRLRTLESVMAGQTADLANIQRGISEIKAQLKDMAGRQ